MLLKFTKMHGLGNDFVIIDNIKHPITLTLEQIKHIAHRQYGIGCDQIIIIYAVTQADADFEYTVFNADGSQAYHCGNGARCVTLYLYTHYQLTAPQIKLKIHHQIILGYKNLDNSISTTINNPLFTPESLPCLYKYNPDNIYIFNLLNQDIHFGLVSVGNPHVVLQLPTIVELNNTENLEHIGQVLQQSNFFPESVNVNFYVILEKDTIQLRTYERGCGFTLACGTGAAATAAYAMLLHQVATPVDLITQGGTLHATLLNSHDIVLTGPASYVFHGEMNLCI